MKAMNRDEAISRFVGTGAEYYKRAFATIGSSSRRVFFFNSAAALLGGIWLGGRRLWGAMWPFLIVELAACAILALALSGGFASDLTAKADRLEALAQSRRTEAETARAEDPNSAITISLGKSATALATAAKAARSAADAAAGPSLRLLGIGLALLVGTRLVLGFMANQLLEIRFRSWRSELSESASGFSRRGVLAAVALILLTVPVTFLSFSGQGAAFLYNVPVPPDWGTLAAAWLDNLIAFTSQAVAPMARGTTHGIDAVLKTLEFALTRTPWPIVMAIILAIAWQIAGFRVFLLTAVAITYISIFGYWERAMQTIALLGTAALLSIAVGIPLGVLCGYNRRVAAFVRPLLDFMQTMPAFVYLIPVIALFGIGKPSAIIATIIFGIPPVVRMTAFGISSVPTEVREAATAFGATRSFLLFRIDLPTAAPSIMTGVSQTILMCLSMAVICSLIGAQGLGEDVLRSLQYASQGQGLLAGFSILACAIVLDRIVQGRRKTA